MPKVSFEDAQRSSDIEQWASNIVEDPRLFHSYAESPAAPHIFNVAIKNGVDIERLLLEVAQLGNREQILVPRSFFMTSARETTSLVAAMLRIPEEIWPQASLFRSSIVRVLCGNVAVFELMAGKYRSQLTNPKHPLFGHFTSDDYWRKRVTKTLKRRKPHVAAACKAIRQANAGFVKNAVELGGDDNIIGPADRCYRASAMTIIELIKATYAAAEKAGFFDGPSRGGATLSPIEKRPGQDIATRIIEECGTAGDSAASKALSLGRVFPKPYRVHRKR